MRSPKASPQLAPDNVPAQVRGIPADVRLRLEKAYPVFLDESDRLDQRFLQGQGTLRDWIRSIEIMPPDLRARLAQNPKFGEVFKPEWLTFIKSIEAALHPKTPEASQLGAVFRLVGKHLKTEAGDSLRTAAAWRNIEHHVRYGTPLRPQSLERHDRHLFAVLRMVDVSPQAASSCVTERHRIAAQTGDKGFFRRWMRTMKKQPDVRSHRLIQDLQLGQLKECLLLRWIKLLPGCLPQVGFCDFQYSAIKEFCGYHYDPKGTHPDKFEVDKVRDAVRRLELIRRKPSSVSAYQIDAKADRVFLIVNG